MEMSLASVDHADTLLLEYVSDGVAVVQDGAIKSANHGLAEITGYDERELTGCPLMDLVHPDDRQAVVEHRFRQLTGKEVSSLHRFRIVDRSGQSRWVEAKELPANWQGKPAVVHILTNVTRLRKAEQELNESERRYRLLAENVSDVIWVTDPSLKPTYLSPSVSRLLGFSVEEAMTGAIQTLLTPRSLEKALRLLAGAFSEESEEIGRASGSPTLALEFKHKDGSTVWASTTVTFMRDSAGHPNGIVGVVRDISEQRRARKRLRESLRTLEKTVDETVRAMASTVETRDPYTAGHQRRVAELATGIARLMGVTRDDLRTVRTAGHLHDLGKISLPADILGKPGALSDTEFALIRTHPRVAYDILKNIESFGRVSEVVLQHHERLDGSGYPAGLKGEQIHLEARVLAVADVVEAMTSHRPYRPSLTVDEAIEEVRQNSGRLYDEEAVRACLEILSSGGFTCGKDVDCAHRVTSMNLAPMGGSRSSMRR
jgi:PAS domain S-box-containing protein